MESAYLIRNIHFFIRRGGFKTLIKVLQSKEPKVDMLSMKWIMKAIIRVCNLFSCFRSRKRGGGSGRREWKYRALTSLYIKAREHLAYPLVEKLVNQLKPMIFSHILELTDEELKGVSRKTIHVVAQCMSTLYHAVGMKDAALLVNRFDLAIAYKFLLSPFLEKRLTGLNDVKNFISLITKKEDYYGKLRATNRPPGNTADPYAHICIDSRYKWRLVSRGFRRADYSPSLCFVQVYGGLAYNQEHHGATLCVQCTPRVAEASWRDPQIFGNPKRTEATTSRYDVELYYCM